MRTRLNFFFFENLPKRLQHRLQFQFQVWPIVALVHRSLTITQFPQSVSWLKMRRKNHAGFQAEPAKKKKACTTKFV